MTLEARDVPAVVYDNTFALTGPGGNATVQVTVDSPAPAATPTYIWTYTVKNVNIGTNNPEDYRQSDSQTSFWLNADAPVAEAMSEFGFLSTATGWTNGLFDSGDGDTTVYHGLYAGANQNSPNLGHTQSAVFAFTTAPRPIVLQPATFGDDTFGEATGDIAGPGALPVVSVARVADAAENGAAGGFVFTRTGGVLSAPLTIAFGISGSATNGADYTSLPATVTFAAGSATATLTVTPKSDNEFEDADYTNDVIDPETVVVTLTDGYGYRSYGSPAVVTITDDPPVVTTTVSWTPSASSDELGRVTVTRSGGDLSQPLTAWVEFSIASTLDGENVTLMMAATVDFAPNVLTQTLTVEINADVPADPNAPSIKIKDATTQPLRADQSAALQALLTGGTAESAKGFTDKVEALEGPLSFKEFELLKMVAATRDAATLQGWFGEGNVFLPLLAVDAALERLGGRIDWRTLPTVNAAQAAIGGVAAVKGVPVVADGWPKVEAQIDRIIVDLASNVFADREAASKKLKGLVDSAIARGDLGRTMLILRKLTLELPLAADAEVARLLEERINIVRNNNDVLGAAYEQFKKELAESKKNSLP